MKSKRSFILKAGLALVLCFILLVGTMTVGLAAIRDELAATGWNTSTSGIAMSTKIYTSAGEVATWTASGMNNSWYQDFDILTTGDYEYQIIGDKWFGSVGGWNTPAYNDDLESHYYNVVYNAHNDNGSKNNISAHFPAGKYVLRLTGNGGSNQDYISYQLYRKRAYLDYGWDGGSWDGNTVELEYQSGGNNYYAYTVTGNGQQLRFRPRYEEYNLASNTLQTTGYFPKGSNVFIGNHYDEAHSYATQTSANENYWYIDTEVGGQYTIWLRNGNVWCTCTNSPVNYFLTGYFEGGSKDIKDANKFTETSTGVYVLTKKFSSADGSGNQYFTITDSTYEVSHPASNDAVNGAEATTTDHVPSNNNKWKCYAPAGMTVTFTWDTTGTNPTLSWVYNSVKLYAKDGASRSDAATYPNYGIIGDTVIATVNGAAPDNNYVTTYNLGTTTEVDSKSYSSTYETAVADKGVPIEITTTVDGDFESKYYVKAFNINGVSYLPTSSAASVGEGTAYTLRYTIPANSSDSRLEITPIYYLKSTYITSKSLTVVTYYIEGFNDSVKSLWGDTIYAYPFYGALYDKNNSFGAYPGQPFLNLNGTYSTEIPVNANVPLGAGDPGSTAVTGVTVNNGYNDKVHQDINEWLSDASHMQTYDSDGFYKIFNEVVKHHEGAADEKPNSITQTLKFRTNENNRYTYGGDSTDSWGYATDGIGKNAPVTSYSNSDAATMIDQIALSGNGWELYTNRYGQAIDLFGNVIEGSAKADEATAAAVRVISSGYIPNIAGDYGTGWLVYYPGTNGTDTASNAGSSSGSYIATNGYTLEYAISIDPDGEGGLDAKNRYAIPPSIFAMQSEASFNTSTYANITRTEDKVQNYDDGSGGYTDSVLYYKQFWQNLNGGTHNVKGKRVYIAYEKNAQIYANTGAYRMDTKWEYTFASDKATSDIEIQYWNTSTNEWTVDSFTSSTNVGSTTGCSAYFTNSGFEGETSCEQLSDGTYSFTAVPASGYMFVGWYVKGAYDNKINSLGSSSATTPVNGAQTYVARFQEVSDGNLSITNTATHTALTYVQVKVYPTSDDRSNNTNILYDSGKTQNNVVLNNDFITNTHTDYAIQVEFSTDPSATNNNVNQSTPFTISDDNGSNDITITSLSQTLGYGECTKSIWFTVGALYNVGTQLYKQLTCTTNVDEHHDTQYVFSYTGRDGSTRTFTADGNTMTSAEKALAATGNNISLTGDRLTDISTKMTSIGLSVFRKTVSAPTKAVDGSDKYKVNVTCSVDDTSYNLTYYYPKTSASAASTTTIGSTTVYYANSLDNGSVAGRFGSKVNLSSIVAPRCLAGKQFYAWCKYSGGTVGEIVSTEENFSYAVTSDMTVIAVYAATSYADDSNTSSAWGSYIDANGVTRDIADAGSYYYNDTLARFTDYKTNAQLSSLGTPEYGVLIVYRLKDQTGTKGNAALSTVCTSASSLKNYINALSNNGAGKNANYGFYAMKLVADSAKISNYNRIVVALKSSYSTYNEAEYGIVTYLKTSNDTIYLSAPVYGTYN